MDDLRVGTLNVNWTSHYSWMSSMLLSRTYRDRGLQASMVRHHLLGRSSKHALCVQRSLVLGVTVIFCQNKGNLEDLKKLVPCLSCVWITRLSKALYRAEHKFLWKVMETWGQPWSVSRIVTLRVCWSSTALCVHLGDVEAETCLGCSMLSPSSLGFVQSLMAWFYWKK